MSLSNIRKVCTTWPHTTITTAEFSVIWLLLLTILIAVPARQPDHCQKQRNLADKKDNCLFSLEPNQSTVV